MKNAAAPEKAPHLSVVSPTDVPATLMTRAQVAARIGASVATVRRHEGTSLHPHVDKDGTHRFDPAEVTALAASRANRALDRGTIRNAKTSPMPARAARSPRSCSSDSSSDSHTPRSSSGCASSPKSCASCSINGASHSPKASSVSASRASRSNPTSRRRAPAHLARQLAALPDARSRASAFGRWPGPLSGRR